MASQLNGLCYNNHCWGLNEQKNVAGNVNDNHLLADQLEVRAIPAGYQCEILRPK